ncbi:MAG: hypothetical protein GY861_03695 [bacterium]|nr:hypothetical protein [bacterium]
MRKIDVSYEKAIELLRNIVLMYEGRYVKDIPKTIREAGIFLNDVHVKQTEDDNK